MPPGPVDSGISDAVRGWHHLGGAMATLTVGGRDVRIRSWPQDGRWCAYAVRLETGDRHGPNVFGDTQDLAVAAAIAWLEWQAAHADAFAALQDAERAYHRSVADAAFASEATGPSARQVQRAALDRLVHARERLDAIRGRQPQPAGREVT